MCVFWCRQNGGIYYYSVCYVNNQYHPYIRRLQEWFDCFFWGEKGKPRMAKQKNNNFPNTTCASLESTAVFSPFFGILTCDDTQKENMVSTPKRKKWANVRWSSSHQRRKVGTMNAHFFLDESILLSTKSTRYYVLVDRNICIYICGSDYSQFSYYYNI